MFAHASLLDMAAEPNIERANNCYQIARAILGLANAIDMPSFQAARALVRKRSRPRGGVLTGSSS